MLKRYIELIAKELGVTDVQTENTIVLLENGATIPFISRYRKELTGSLDEVQVAQIRNRLEQLKELDKRRDSILASVKEQEKLTPELEKQINNALTLSELEDIYLPCRHQNRSRDRTCQSGSRQ